MKKIAYIIGHRTSCDPFRQRNLFVILKWLTNLKNILLTKYDIVLKIVIVEQDDTQKLKICDKTITHIFIYNPGFFNRGWGFNVGFQAIEANYYFFADNDIILKNDDIICVFLKCFKYDAVNPYHKLYDSTNEYIDNPDFDPSVHNSKYTKIFAKRKNICFGGGIVGIKKRAFDSISGWNENFRGRGWEDYAFTAKLKLFLCKLHTFKNCAIHLWHKCEEDTTRKQNYELSKKYQTYNVNDYINEIEKSRNFGYPLKYSQFGEEQISICKKKLCKSQIKHAHKIFNKICKYIRKKYKLPKCGKLYIYIYLYLCDQLCNINYYESGCDDYNESGCRSDCNKTV